MKKAGQGCAKEILKINKSKNFLIYCGPGNNGGDGFIIGHELINKGYQKSELYQQLILANTRAML